ncbi:MAG TPA: methyltransferase domain-containing protein [Steroidobacteraceae bacterium]|nr:methyltransferase domain-containing protein [Steroidobacteraceae bacterium]
MKSDGVVKELSRSWRRLRWHSKRRFGRIDRAIIEKYLDGPPVRKLHIGCGDHLLDGWLNADLFPRSPLVLHLDSTEPFPFDDGQFDYIFSEHMIEHISYPQGLQMLSQCHRVLKRNGTIRISTPSLPFLIELYRANASELQRAYVRWATEQFLGFAPRDHPTFVINNFVRDWGHQFIYDDEILSASLRQAGFTEVVRYELNESGDEMLRNLENERRMPPGFLRLETMTLQAKKGPRAAHSPK